MHDLHALSSEQQATLFGHLDSDVNEHGLDSVASHGFLTAITVGPRGRLDDTALAALFDDQPVADDLKALLLAWQKSIHAALYHGERLQLPCELRVEVDDSTDLNDWCAGFMEGLFLDEDDWYRDHEDDVADMTLPMVVLSELIDDEDLQAIRRDQRLIRDMAREIPELITALYLLYHAPANA